MTAATGMAMANSWRAGGADSFTLDRPCPSVNLRFLTWARWPVATTIQVPYLRLRGYWLQHVGFSAGQRVRVHVADGRITILRLNEILTAADWRMGFWLCPPA